MVDIVPGTERDFLVDSLVSQPAEQPGAFKRGLKAGAAGVKASLYGAGALAARGIGAILPAAAAPIAQGVEQAALDAAAEQNALAAEGAVRFEDVVAGPSRAGEFIKYAAGSAVPSLALMAAGGGLGATAGKVFGRNTAATLAARAAGTVAPAVKTGALVGAVAPDFAVEAGSIYPEALKTGVENPALRATVGGAGAAAIDFLTLPTAVKALLPAEKAATRAAGVGGAVRSIATQAVKRGATAGGAEAAQELSQSFIERAAAGQSLTDKEAVSDYINSALIGGIAGLGLGGAAGSVHGAVAPIERPAGAPLSAPTEAPAPPTEPTPPPVPPTPQEAHANLVAQHATATEQLNAAQTAVEQAKQQQAALEARRAELDAESKLEIGQRRPKADIVKEKRATAAELKTLKDNTEALGGQLFTARSAVDDLAKQVELSTNELAKQSQISSLEPAQVLPNEAQNNGVANVANLAANEAVSATPAPVDRRVNLDLRARFETMSPEEKTAALADLQTKAYTSQVTGLPNQRAFAERVAASPDTKVLYSDVDGLKALNTQYGHAGADQILKIVGDVKAEVAKAMGVEAFHRSGDEFLATHADPAVLNAYGTAVQNKLDNMTVKVTRPDGTTAEHTGIGLSFGVAENDKRAEIIANAQKAERKAAARNTPAVSGEAAAGNENNRGSIQGQVAKKPWEMTRDEYIAGVKEGRIDANGNPIAKPAAAPLATNIHDYIVEELAKKKGSPERKIKLAEQIDSAIADITTTAATIAPDMRAGVIASMVKSKVGGKVSADVQAEIVKHIEDVVSGTQQSKGATEIGDLSKRSTSDLRGLEKQIGDAYVNGAISFDEFIKQSGPVSEARLRAELRANKEAPAKGIVDVFPGFKNIPVGVKVLATHGTRYATPTPAVVVGSRAMKSSLDGMVTMLPIVDFGDGKPRTLITGGVKEVFAPRLVAESRAAITQDEFDAMPEEAKVQVMTAFDAAMQKQGLALRARLTELVGDRPELLVRTFQAGPGGAIGSYTRIGPLKAAISMAVNAKEGLSVADHEGYHFAEDALLSTAEKRIVSNAMKPGRPLYEALKKRLQQYDVENQTSLTDEVTAVPAEARAYGFEFWRRGELKADGPLARTWQKLKQFFERVANAVRGLGFQSIEDVFTALDQGQMAERETAGGEGGAFSSIAGGRSWYRSMLTESVAAIQSKQASAQGWKDQIKGLVSNGKVKQAEIEATGLNDWLDLQQGKVTKDQVMAFLGENGVQVRDVTLGEQKLSPAEEERYLELNGMNNRGELSGRANRETWNEYLALRAKQERGATKFARYQLPGGENYKELLLTLPAKEGKSIADKLEVVEGDSPTGRGYFLGVRNRETGEMIVPMQATPYPPAQFLAAQTSDHRAGRGREAAPSQFRSSHFDQPNILAHVRFNERTDAEGKRVLFLEELQSDWAQKGRKEGFASAVASDPRIPELRRLQREARDGAARERFNELWDAVYKDYGIPDSTPLDDVLKPGVPSAPFVGKTEAWTALALKRMIRYAAENGFDRIAWTTGEQQAARYDLSKQMQRIVAKKHGDGFAIGGVDTNGNPHEFGTYTADKLSDVVGKDLAEKIANQKTANEVYAGNDLKVGGEGMKGYYDKIVPSVANDVLKKLGGGKVGEVALSIGVDSKDEGGKYNSDLKMFAREMKQPGFDITDKLAENAAHGLPLFSKAAATIDVRMRNGELETSQQFNAVADLVQSSRMHTNDDLLRTAIGPAFDGMTGGIKRWWMRYISTPNYIAAFSKGYKNVMHTLNSYIRYRETLIERMLREQMPQWYTASFADQDVTFAALLDRTVNMYEEDSPQYQELMRKLTPEQQVLFNSATKMVAGFLDAELEVDAAAYKEYLKTPGAYEKWLTDRTAAVADLKKHGYIPLRRYGDFTVRIYKDIVDAEGKTQKLTVHLEMFQTEAKMLEAQKLYQAEFDRAQAPYQIEVGTKHKTVRDTTISVQQYLDTARRNGVEISATERERLVLALTASESQIRNRLLHRENVPGFSRDGLRVLNEFGVNMSGKIAYAKFASAIDAAADGRAVTSDVVNGQPQIEIDYRKQLPDGEYESVADYKARSLWTDTDPMTGYYRNLSDELSDYVLVPDNTGTWSTKLRGAAMMYFIGGSISGAMVNAMSVPMMLVPQLSIHTNYANGMAEAMSAWRTTWANQSVLRDITKLKDKLNYPIPEIDNVPGLREALISGADKLMDTELHQIMAISQGSFFSQSRTVQKAMETWMAPFRISEQTNRITSFIAAYKVGKANGLKEQALFNFARDMVDATQNNYSAANRPGAARHPVYAMAFMFKSFPLFMTEAIHLMYKANPKSAVFMLLGLVMLTGVQGLPFAETLLNLIDTISQGLFGSPFNARRAMRNTIKGASEALVGYDLSDIVLRGVMNEITGMSIASRIGAGDFVPGTRLGTADADQGRILSEFVGAPYSMVKDVASNAGKLVGGVFTGDWKQTADALRGGGPIAARNVIKGIEQFQDGYASDSRGRKVVDVSSIAAFWQLLGVSSAGMAKMYDMETINIQTKAFYTQVSQDMQEQLANAIRANDVEKVQEINTLRNKWNEQYPETPIMPNAASLRRSMMLAGLPMDKRSVMLWSRRIRGANMFSEQSGEE